MAGAVAAAILGLGQGQPEAKSYSTSYSSSSDALSKSSHVVPGTSRSQDRLPVNSGASDDIDSGASAVPEPALVPIDVASLPINAKTPSEFGIGPQSQIGPSGTLVAHAVSATVTAYAEPDRASERLQIFQNPTERGGPRVFQALSRSGDGWIEVLLPIRPNGSRGWIREEAVTLSSNPYQIAINVSNHELSIYRGNELQMQTVIGVGTGQTPTPIGSFYLTELLRPSDPTGIYGPYAYGLSGYSDTLRSFNGGEGVIGIHGTNDAEALGGDVSHGCIRVENGTIEEMVQYLPLGTPVNIYRTDNTVPLPADENMPQASADIGVGAITTG